MRVIRSKNGRSYVCTVARWGHFVPKSESQREHAHLTTHAQNHCMRALYCGLHCEKMEPWSPSLLSGTIDDLITAYFQAGHRYKKIVQFLCVVHGAVLSVRQLKRKLRQFGLRRRASSTATSLRFVTRLVRVGYLYSMCIFFIS